MKPMLTLPFTVPEAALTDRETRRLAHLTREAGGTWLRASDGQPGGWPAATNPDAVALPVAEAPVFAPHRGRAALHLATGENRGFRLSDAVPDPSRWSAAILWASDEPALALLAVRAERGGNPLHLSDTAEGLVLRDDDGTAAARGPAAAGVPGRRGRRAPAAGTEPAGPAAVGADRGGAACGLALTAKRREVSATRHDTSTLMP